MSWRAVRAPLVAALLFICATVPLAAQATAADSVTAPTVYLMTMGPGREVWERFGHNALWIHDPAHGTDLTYNYGLFDFRQHNFILRFIQGKMLYWMDGAPVDYYLRLYRYYDRSIWIQELNLPADARRELQSFLAWNARPENRYYRYDYYRDNCSTRVRDALDRVLHGQLRAQTEHLPVAATYRFHTQRLTTNDIPIYTGLYAALGPAVDRPLNAWEEMFLPLAMREHIRHVRVRDEAGREVPLVNAERTLYESTLRPPPATPPSWTHWYLLVGLLIGGLIALLGVRASSSRTAARVVAIWGMLWGVVIGVAGIVLAGLWLATDHVMAYRNLNLFYVDPLALPLALLVPLALRGSAAGRRAAWGVATAVAGIAVLGALLQLLPGIDQNNGPIIASTLPIHLGVAFAVQAIVRSAAHQNASRIPSIAASTTSRGAVRQA